MANAHWSELKPLLCASFDFISLDFIGFIFPISYSDFLFHSCAGHIPSETRQNAREGNGFIIFLYFQRQGVTPLVNFLFNNTLRNSR